MNQEYKYILFENKGEIDNNALILMGGSTKRNDPNKIGMWGSGWKYTIAGLIKKNIDFKLFSGEREVVITTVKEKFRDTTLNKIVVDGKETSLTVEMGADSWEEWFFIRESYQNAIDEGECNVIPNCEVISGREKKTRFYIQQTPEIQEVINNWDYYFSTDRLDCIYTSNIGNIFPNIDKDEYIIAYKQGIRCTNIHHKSLFNYNIDTLEINESRLVKDDWALKAPICKLLCSLTDVNVIKTILSQLKSEYFENSVFFYSAFQLSKQWREAIDNHKIIVQEITGWFVEEQQKYDCYILPNDLCKKIQQQFPDVEIYGLNKDGSCCDKREVVLDKRQDFLLKQCMEFLKEANYSIDYPIKVVEFEDDSLLGLAEKGTIFVSIKQFLKGGL